MKNKKINYQLFGASVIGMMICLLILLSGCSKPIDMPPVIEHHISIIDEDTYLFSTSQDNSNVNIPSQNGDTYSYELEGKKVSIKTDLDPKWVVYHTSNMDRKGRVVYRIDGAWTENNLTRYGYFRFKY